MPLLANSHIAEIAAEMLVDPYTVPAPPVRFLKLVERVRRRIREISVHELTQFATALRPVLIDVREFSEWRNGHVSGALHLSRGLIDQRLEGIVGDVRMPLVCYCTDGTRSILAAESIQRLGYRDVRVLTGGLLAWEEAGFPTVGHSAWD